MQELIQRRLRIMLADHCTAHSVLREIENEFEAADIRFTPDASTATGARRALVEGYCASLNFSDPGDVRKFLNVTAAFLERLEISIRAMGDEPDTTTPESPYGKELARFQQQLGRDGYRYTNGSIVPTTATARLADAKALAVQFDAIHINEQIRRIETAIDADPALAIGQAKELTESCFKTILKDRAVEYDKDDILQLGKKVFRALKLVPDDIPAAAKGADTIRRTLSNLATVVQGIAEIRNLYGTGHGRDGTTRGVSPRHARLAVGAAATLVTFVFQTHVETGRNPG